MQQETWYDLAVRELSERADPVAERLIEAAELEQEAEAAGEAEEPEEGAPPPER
jgi:hypothetical protein